MYESQAGRQAGGVGGATTVLLLLVLSKGDRH